MPAGQKNKTKVIERNFDCQINGSKLDGRVGASFYAEYSNNSKQAFFHLGIRSTAFLAEVLASYSKSGKEPAFGKNAQSKCCCAGG